VPKLEPRQNFIRRWNLSSLIEMDLDIPLIYSTDHALWYWFNGIFTENSVYIYFEPESQRYIYDIPYSSDENETAPQRCITFTNYVCRAQRIYSGWVSSPLIKLQSLIFHPEPETHKNDADPQLW
jgi:hypothetical protein